MMNGIWFHEIHSYEHLNLVLSKVSIPPAAVKTTYLDIPGSDGSLDLTEALGEVKYKDRECSFTFTVLPGDDFEEKKTEVSNCLNGRRFAIVLDKDPDYYWEGRCFLNQYASDKNIGQIVVGATVAPYKRKREETKVRVRAGTRVPCRLRNGRMTVTPLFSAASSGTVLWNGLTYSFSAGQEKKTGLRLTEGVHELWISCRDDVTVSYREGAL